MRRNTLIPLNIPRSSSRLAGGRRDVRAMMRFRLIQQALFYLLTAAWAVLAATWAPRAVAAADTPPSQEYFVKQEAGEALLIKLVSFEAEIESRVFGPQKSLLAVSSLAGNRIAPLFQFISPTDSPRQLDIEVRASRRTGNSKFEIEFTRLKAWDERSSLVMRAYLLLAYSMQTPQRSVRAAWSDRVSALISAAKLFAQFGMQEQRLWSSYLAAYLAYNRLGDAEFAAGINDGVLAEVRGSRWQEIDLAARQLQAVILVNQRKAGGFKSSGKEDDPVQAALFAEAQLAQTMGYGYQRAWAVFTSGLDYAEQALYPQALAQYHNALQLAEPLGDDQLANDIRESIVAANASTGNATASGRVLRQIGTQLLREGKGDELALNLLQQGELLMRSHLYPQAGKVLAQALEHQNDSSIRSRANFALAQASFEMGEADAALAQLRAAGINSRLRPSGRGGSLLDAAAGLQIMAAIYRARGEFGPMAEARSAQKAWLENEADRSAFYYQKGLDALAQNGVERTRAGLYFRRSLAAAATAGRDRERLLAQLQLCAVQLDTAEPCGAGSTRKAYETLVAGGVPRQAAAATWLRARYLAKHGSPGDAVMLLQQLVADIYYYRQQLPGMLGAWYWQWHDELFGDYLDTVGRAPRPVSSSRDRDFETLLALTRIRFAAAAATGPRPTAEPETTETLRQRLVTLEAAQDDRPAAGVRPQIEASRREFDAAHAFLSAAGLERMLGALSPQEAVLTYHLSSGEAQAWLAQAGRVRRFHIDHPERLYANLQSARENLPHLSPAVFDRIMRDLGEQLLGPLAGQLPQTVYFVPDGLLTGFPVDALKLGQHYLAEQHRVVNLLAFPSDREPRSGLKMSWPKEVFLAGLPQDYSGSVEAKLETSGEIQAVADRFVGPGLQIVQGSALLGDEFRGGPLQQAALLHLSMPGVIDLAERDRSGLVLSEPRRGAGRERLAPADIAAVPIKAGLVFLSATRMQGETREAFTAQPGLVSDYLAAGAEAVIAGSWRTDNESAIAMVRGFYVALAAGGDIAAALAQSKREFLQQHKRQPATGWAAYQLYIR